jgi:hypothetical protein
MGHLVSDPIHLAAPRTLAVGVMAEARAVERRETEDVQESLQ